MTLLVVEMFVRQNEDTVQSYHCDGLAQKFDRLNAYEPEPKILLLGSSRTHYGLVPGIFERASGYATFNLGVSASTLPEWRLIARRALQNCKPNLIVVGMNGRMLRADGVPAMAACQLFDFSDLIEHSVRYEWSNQLLDYYLSYQVMGRLKTWRYTDQLNMWLNETVLDSAFPKYAQLARERRALVTLDLPADGFDHPRRIGKSQRTLPEMIDACGAEYLRPPPVPSFSTTDESLVIFDDLLAELRDSGAAVLVCYLPNSPRTEAIWREREPLMIESIAAIAMRHGIAFLDASTDELPRTDADFIDDTHVDIDLAERLSWRAARHVIRIGLIDRNAPKLAGNLVDNGIIE